MNTLELLKKAIELQKPISFEYTKEGEVTGKRIGNTHAVFVFTKKTGEQDTKVDLFQTGGISNTKNEKPLPSWRFFSLKHFLNIEILENEQAFNEAEGYKPESDRYIDVIAKI